jgi:hypothetical protein
MAQTIASWTWDVTHERAVSGNVPVGVLIGLLERIFTSAHAAQVHSLCASATAVYSPFFLSFWEIIT